MRAVRAVRAVREGEVVTRVRTRAWLAGRPACAHPGPVRVRRGGCVGRRQGQGRGLRAAPRPRRALPCLPRRAQRDGAASPLAAAHLLAAAALLRLGDAGKSGAGRGGRWQRRGGGSGAAAAAAAAAVRYGAERRPLELCALRVRGARVARWHRAQGARALHVHCMQTARTMRSMSMFHVHCTHIHCMCMCMCTGRVHTVHVAVPGAGRCMRACSAPAMLTMAHGDVSTYHGRCMRACSTTMTRCGILGPVSEATPCGSGACPSGWQRSSL